MTAKADSRTALVIGATGSVGGAIAERLVAGGWRVRALNRNPQAAQAGCGLSGVEWVRGDAMVEAEVISAAQGCDLLVHGANPPAYRNWAGLQMPMLASSMAAAKAAGARLVFPGTVYNYGPDAFPNLTEASPQHPTTRKGAIRMRMEQALAAAADDGLKVLIVRCGDFFAPRPVNSWLTQGMVQPGKPITSVRSPGPLEVAHSWAWLPDIAETVARLLALPDLGAFEVFHMRGHTQTAAELIAGLEAAAGRKLKVSQLPWFAIHAVAPFNETFREMLEMRYLWNRPVLLDNAKLVTRLGAEPHTPLTEALRAALIGAGALPKAPEALAA
ncbi:MAG TPA: NAD-dependent epimerase/dehydratase family protein [Phenylobacterium sp.]|jgi:nucleoside-diphosphate-sugar epimerase